MAKLTPWFPPHIKPVREGVYQAQCVNGEYWWSRWYRGQWRVGYTMLDRPGHLLAAALEKRATPFLRKLWRGLASPPKGQRNG